MRTKYKISLCSVNFAIQTFELTKRLELNFFLMQVEAAIAVQMMLTSKGEAARQYLEPQIREITLELLKIIR